MNRKGFLILLAALVVLGCAGLALFWQDLNAWRGGGTARIGAKPFEKLAVNNIAQIHLVDGKGEVTLAIKGNSWVVKQRSDYPANSQDISELLLKLPDLKVVQSEDVGASLLPRLNLVKPGSDAKDADSAGTEFDMSDKSGKIIASTLLGKQVIKIEDSPLPIKPHTPVGRYILVPGNQTVLVVSDPLTSAQATPGRWLAKDFFKVDRVKSLAANGSSQWKIALPEEYGQWKFAQGGGDLDRGAAAAAVKALGELAFVDIAPDVKADSLQSPRIFTAETFDNVTYTIKVAPKPGSDNYYLTFSVAGDPPRERTPEKGEKPEDKAREDKQYASDLIKLDARLKFEKILSDWTFVVDAKTLEPLLKDRAQLVAVPRKPGAPGMPPGMAGMMPVMPH